MAHIQNFRRALATAVLASLIACGAITFNSDNPAFANYDRKHHLLTEELKKYADTNGVHYKRWQSNPQKLVEYLDSLNQITPDELKKLSPSDKEALWLNVYDALTIKIVLDHYPIRGAKDYYPPDSVRQIRDLWEAFYTNVAGEKVNLYQVEHDVLRKDIHDYRTHFAVLCGARGCCAVPRYAYTGAALERQLNRAMETFLANKKNVDIDPAKNIIYVSQIFKWFPLDFAAPGGYGKIAFPPPTDDDIVLGFLAHHGPTAVREALSKEDDRSRFKVMYREFDWSLNDADSAVSGQSTGP